MTPSSTHSTDASPGAPKEAAWGAVLTLTLSVFGLVTAEFLPVSLLTPISNDLGITPGAAGQTITTTAIVAAFAGPGVVIGTRKLDRRLTVLALTMLLVLSTLIAAMANGLFMLLTARFLLGIGLGGFWAMSAALAMRLVPPEKLPRAMALIMAGVSGATVLAAPLGAWIGATMGWRMAFFLAAALGVVALIGQIVALPKMPPSGHAGLGTMVALLRRPLLRLCFIAMIFMIGGHFAGFTYIRPYLELVPHLDVDQISLTLLAYGVAGFVGTALGGMVVEKRGPRFSITLWGSLMAAAAVVMAVGGQSPSVAVAGVAFWGLAFGAIPVSIQNYITSVAGDEAESAGALMLTTFQIAISSGAILGGVLIEGLGPISVIVFLAVGSLAGASVLAAGGRTRTALSEG